MTEATKKKQLNLSTECHKKTWLVYEEMLLAGIYTLTNQNHIGKFLTKDLKDLEVLLQPFLKRLGGKIF